DRAHRRSTSPIRPRNTTGIGLTREEPSRPCKGADPRACTPAWHRRSHEEQTTPSSHEKSAKPEELVARLTRKTFERSCTLCTKKLCFSGGLRSQTWIILDDAPIYHTTSTLP